MARLLYIESSPRKERSESIKVAQEFLNEYRRLNPLDQVETLDLWREELPAFSNDVINAKYRIMHGEVRSTPERAAWVPVEQIINRFKRFDKYLFSLPMWNFGIPYILKHYIDLIVQPGYTFSYTPDGGYAGLVTDKPVALIYARGGAYGPATGAADFDQQTRYMEAVLGFIGFTDIRSIVIEPTLQLGQADHAALIEAKRAEARELAGRF